jgi:hypothetical protein
LATTKIEARGWMFQVGVGAGPTWTPVGGISSFTFNPGDKTQETEVTDFDSQGNFEQVITQRGATMKVDGRRRMDRTTGLADPGQAALDALAQGVVDFSVGQIRFRYKNETQWRVWNCTVKAAEQGGATNDISKWGVEITRTGAETYMAAP